LTWDEFESSSIIKISIRAIFFISTLFFTLFHYCGFMWISVRINGEAYLPCEVQGKRSIHVNLKLVLDICFSKFKFVEWWVLIYISMKLRCN